MKRYFIPNEHQIAVIGWCEERMVMRKDYIWFPMYMTNKSNRQALRLDIFKDEDATSFFLVWGDLVE